MAAVSDAANLKEDVRRHWDAQRGASSSRASASHWKACMRTSALPTPKTSRSPLPPSTSFIHTAFSITRRTPWPPFERSGAFCGLEEPRSS